MVIMEHICSKFKIIISANIKRRGECIIPNKIMSYTFAAIAGLFFASGIAVLTGGKVR